MPSVAEAPRVLLDESSFDFRGLADEQVERHLDDLNVVLTELRSRDRHQIGRPPLWDAVKCLDGCELWRFLCREHQSEVDRDTLVLTYTLLERCQEWEPLAGAETTVTIGGGSATLALSVAHAHGLALLRRGAACLVFPGSGRHGFLPVGADRGEAQIFFFHDAAALPAFWRHLFAFENVGEGEFFNLALLAFPGLVLHPGLSFRRFEGNYRDLRDRVAAILAVICDHFATEYRRCKGLPSDIQAALGPHQVDLSPESPNTRSSERLMRQRDVARDGATYRCEWHAKLEPHRNRIHFAEPAAKLGGRVLIGLFVSHLDT